MKPMNEREFFSFSAGVGSVRTAYALAVIKRLPDGYIFTPNDVALLNAADKYWDGAETPHDMTSAMSEMLASEYSDHCDPYELLIDSGIFKG